MFSQTVRLALSRRWKMAWTRLSSSAADAGEVPHVMATAREKSTLEHFRTRCLKRDSAPQPALLGPNIESSKFLRKPEGKLLAGNYKGERAYAKAGDTAALDAPAKAV
jgi:hypothetical protein